MKIKDFEYFIIVDEDLRPMAWCDDQLCYTNDERYEGDVHPAKAYTRAQAKRHIRNTNKFRIKYGYTLHGYYLMPIEIPKQ